MENRTKLLIVDDEKQICELLASHYSRRGYDVLTAISGSQAIDLTRTHNPQIMLLDKRMPDMDGIATLEEIRKFNQGIKVIMVSADLVDAEMIGVMEKLKILSYLRKPVIITELDMIVKEMIF